MKKPTSFADARRALFVPENLACQHCGRQLRYNKAKTATRQEVHDWRMHLKPDKTVEDLSKMFNPVIRGWINYYGRFYKSELYPVLVQLNGL